MNRQSIKINSRWLLCTMLIMSMSIPAWAGAQTQMVDAMAMKLLQRMTEKLGSLKQFSVHTEVTLEDRLDSGHRIDLDVSANVSIVRPDRLYAERKGDPIDQSFYYNGKTLTLYNPNDKVYATETVPNSIEAMLDHARESLGLMVPVADLVYDNAFELLSKDVSFAMVLDKTVIGGVRCHHLLFSRPGVDFQLWISDDNKLLPYKYVVTDTGNPGQVSVSTVMSDWDFRVLKDEKIFNFVVPDDARAIDFLPASTLNTSIK